jgi:hypothetical protein
VASLFPLPPDATVLVSHPRPNPILRCVGFLHSPAKGAKERRATGDVAAILGFHSIRRVVYESRDVYLHAKHQQQVDGL